MPGCMKLRQLSRGKTAKQRKKMSRRHGGYESNWWLHNELHLSRRSLPATSPRSLRLGGIFLRSFSQDARFIRYARVSKLEGGNRLF
jgi:hypothetical protein